MNIENTVKSSAVWIAFGFLAAIIMTGCGSNGGQDQIAAAEAKERDKLLAENQALDQVRAENQEVQRLKKENEELPKLRSQYQEAARLRKENETLRQQVAKISHANPVPSAVEAARAASPALLAQQDKPKDPKDAALEEGALEPGDDILIEPKYLKLLLPDFDWEKLERKDPLAIRSLIEKDGVQLTNALQLKEYGITNYIIQRAPSKPPALPQPKP